MINHSDVVAHFPTGNPSVRERYVSNASKKKRVTLSISGSPEAAAKKLFSEVRFLGVSSPVIGVFGPPKTATLESSRLHDFFRDFWDILASAMNIKSVISCGQPGISEVAIFSASEAGIRSIAAIPRNQSGDVMFDGAQLTVQEYVMRNKNAVRQSSSLRKQEEPEELQGSLF